MFYAAEAAVVSLADRHGIDTKQQHWLKADAAKELHQRGLLSEDYGPLLKQLNQVRTDVCIVVQPWAIDPSWTDDQLWAAKLADDAARARLNQTPAQRQVTVEVLKRAVDAGAQSVALTGSTARNRRTQISDLDYHLVGPRPDVSDLPGDVDLYVGMPDRFWRKLRSGDDFVQWTLRFGCILFDAGPFRDGLRVIATEGIWPNGESKLARIPELTGLAQRLIKMGDRDAGQDQVRAALTAFARGLLLTAGVFPLSRSELPGQLKAIGRHDVASRLADSVYRQLSLAELEEALTPARRLRVEAGSSKESGA